MVAGLPHGLKETDDLMGTDGPTPVRVDSIKAAVKLCKVTCEP